MGDAHFGIDPSVAKSIAAQIKRVLDYDVQIGVVIGGGNIWRGLVASSKGMDRATADYMGMVATVLNAPRLAGRAREGRCLHPGDDRHPDA